MQTRAAVMPVRHGRWSIETLEVAEPGPDEVLVRVIASGICQTDVHARDGFFPIPCPAVYGHEGAGIVERIGAAVTTLAPGDHVIMANPSCGACPDCLSGFETYCANASKLKQSGFRSDGASVSFSRGGERVYGSFFQQSSFASHTLATARNTIRVPKDLLTFAPGRMVSDEIRSGVRTAIYEATRPQRRSGFQVGPHGPIARRAVSSDDPPPRVQQASRRGSCPVRPHRCSH